MRKLNGHNKFNYTVAIAAALGFFCWGGWRNIFRFYYYIPQIPRKMNNANLVTSNRKLIWRPLVVTINIQFIYIYIYKTDFMYHLCLLANFFLCNIVNSFNDIYHIFGGNVTSNLAFTNPSIINHLARRNTNI